MKLRLIFFLIVGLFGLFGVCFANESDHESTTQEPLKGTFQIGGSFNTGNDSTRSVDSKIAAHYETERWDNLASLSGELDQNDQATTAEQAELNGELRYIFTERDYFFAKTNAVYDKFNAYDILWRTAVGYGRILYKTERAKISTEVGPGVAVRRTAGTNQLLTEPIVSTAVIATYKISETTQFKQLVNVDIGADNTYTKLVSTITTRMTQRLAMELSFNIENNSYIPPESTRREHTDTSTKVAVVYHFGAI